MFRLIKENERYEIPHLVTLIYGQPGVGKTTVTQTSKNPITLDFDNAAWRSQFRKSAYVIQDYKDIVNDMKAFNEIIADYDTVNVDTVSTLLDYIGAYLKEKDFRKYGGESFHYWGALKKEFISFITNIRMQNKEITLLAQETEKGYDEIKQKRPKMSGGSYDIIIESSSLIGYMYVGEGGKVRITFDPTESIYAKNAGKIKSHVIPNMADEPDYFERLIKSAKAHMLKGQIENTEKIDWFESIKKEIEKLPEPNYAELLKNLPKHYQKELRTNKKLQEDVKTLIEINKIPVDEHFPAKFEDCSGVAQMDEYLTINKGKKGMLKSAKAFLAENEMTIHKTFGVIWQKNEEYYNDLELLVSEENYEGIAGFVDDETDEFRKEIEYKLKRFAGIDEVDGVYYAEN